MKKIMDIDEMEKMVEEALEHFEVTDEERKGGFWTVKNTEPIKKLLGIGYMLGSCGAEVRKACIIIDYEAGYPLIVGRAIPR